MDFGWSNPFGSGGGSGTGDGFLPSSSQLVQQLQLGTPDGEEMNDQLMIRRQMFYSNNGARIRTLETYDFTQNRPIRLETRIYPIGRGIVAQTDSVTAGGGIRLDIAQSPGDLQEHLYLEVGTGGSVERVEYQFITVGTDHTVVVETNDGKTWTVTLDNVAQTETLSGQMTNHNKRWLIGSYVDKNCFAWYASIDVTTSSGAVQSAVFDIQNNPRYAYVYDVSGNERHADIRGYNPECWRLFYQGENYNWPKVYGVNCITLDGIDDHVVAPVNLVTGTEYEVQMFFKCNDASNTPFLYDGEGDHWINLTTLGDVSISYNFGAVTIATAGTNYADGNWHSVRMKSEALQGVFLYVDNVFIGRDNIDMISNGIGNILFGTAIGAASNFLNGDIGFVFLRKADQIIHLFPMQEGAIVSDSYDVVGNVICEKLSGVLPETLAGTTDDLPSWNLRYGCSDEVGGGFVPAKLNSTLDAKGDLIQRPGGYVHNGCEAKLQWRDTITFSASNIVPNEVYAIAFPAFALPVIDDFRVEFKCVPNGVDECGVDIRDTGGPPHLCRIQVQPTQVLVGIWNPTRTDYIATAPVANEINKIKVNFVNGILNIDVNGTVTTFSGLDPIVSISPSEIRIGRASDGPPIISNGNIYDVLLAPADAGLPPLGIWYARTGVGRSLPDSSTFNNACAIQAFNTGDPWDDALPIRGPSFWTDAGGTVYEPRSYLDFFDHLNGDFNLWLDFITYGNVTLLWRTAEYELDWVPTDAERGYLDDVFSPAKPPIYIDEIAGDTYTDETGLNIYTGE
jgi:hypothetical protein